MATKQIYQQEKMAVWSVVEGLLGELCFPEKSKKNWRITQDSRFSIFVTYSKMHTHSKVFWYDLSKKDLDSWLLYEERYIILIANHRNNTFVVPVEELKKALIKSGTKIALDGTYKFHLKENDDLIVLVEEPGFDLAKYHNNYLPFSQKRRNSQHDIHNSKLVYAVEEFEEIVSGKIYREGTTKEITVNAYERDSEARAVCIRVYGTTCSVCGFDFEEVYGEHGKDFIHVHHLKPLSEIREEYTLDPIEGLRPVCPNCHAMIHRKNKFYSIEEIQSIIKAHRK